MKRFTWIIVAVAILAGCQSPQPEPQSTTYGPPRMGLSPGMGNLHAPTMGSFHAAPGQLGKPVDTGNIHYSPGGLPAGFRSPTPSGQ